MRARVFLAGVAFVAAYGLARGATAECLIEVNGKCEKEKPPPSVARVVVEANHPADFLLMPKRTPLCSGTRICKKAVVLRELEFQVVVAADGYSESMVTLSASKGWEAKAELKRCPELNIDLSDLPEGTSFRLEGNLMGQWPRDAAKVREAVERFLRPKVLPRCKLPEGSYNAEFTREGYFKSSVNVSLAYGGKFHLKPAMKTTLGSIIVESQIGGADLLIDLQPRGRLNSATKRNVVQVISGVVPGNHTVELRLANGAFSQSQDVTVAEGATATVKFELKPIQRVEHNPARFKAEIPLLKELCEVNADACLTLGWAYRWGVGGAANQQAAAEAFKQACQDASAGRRSSDALSETEIQGCTAFAWMLDTGLARDESVGDTRSHYRCSQGNGFLQDPVSPCLRPYLSPDGQQAADPTLFVDHAPGTTTLGRPMFVLVGAGPRQRLAHAGIGLSAGIDTVAFESFFTAGYTQVKRWDAAYTREDWKPGFGMGLELGLSFRLADHVLGLIHPRLELVSISTSKDQSDVGMILGGRVGLAFTTSNIGRGGYFIEPGVVVGWVTRELVRPTSDELVERALQTNDLDELDRSWGRTNDTALMFSILPAVTVGKVF